MAETAGNSDQSMSIHEAAEKCNVIQLQRALAAGASPNFRDGFGHVAVWQPQMSAVMAVRERGQRGHSFCVR